MRRPEIVLKGDACLYCVPIYSRMHICMHSYCIMHICMHSYLFMYVHVHLPRLGNGPPPWTSRNGPLATPLASPNLSAWYATCSLAGCAFVHGYLCCVHISFCVFVWCVLLFLCLITLEYHLQQPNISATVAQAIYNNIVITDIVPHTSVQRSSLSFDATLVSDSSSP